MQAAGALSGRELDVLKGVRETDLAHLDDMQLRALALAKFKVEREKEYNQLRDYWPYPVQAKFHALGAQFRERQLRGSNQCLTPWTPIQTAVGERLIGDMISERGFGVRSWDGGSRCAAQADHVFLKGIEPAFRIHLDNGEVFECSGKHRVLTCAGWLSLAQLVRAADGWHYRHVEPSSAASCDTGSRPSGQALRRPQGIDRAQPPSLGDAQEHSHWFGMPDEEAQRSEYSRTYPASDRLPTVDDEPQRLADLFWMFEAHSGARTCRLSSDTLLTLSRYLVESSRRQAWSSTCPGPVRSGAHSFGLEKPLFRADAGNGQHHLSVGQGAKLYPSASLPPNSTEQFLRGEPGTAIFLASDFPLLVGGQTIIAVEGIGLVPIVDFEVFGTHCYEAAGVIHHNSGKTLSASREVAMHLTGRYAPYWRGKRFTTANHWLAGCESGELTKKGIQRLLFGRDIRAALGTGAIPLECIERTTLAKGVSDLFDTAYIKHESGTTSSIGLKSYEQGRGKWAADTVDGIWYDEEPPLDIYTEGLTRTNTTMGPIINTLTPLQGVTPLIRRFDDNTPGTVCITMTIYDSEHYTDEQRAAIIASYPEHEKDARAFGKPVQGSGLVYPIAQERIQCEAFEIPGYWPRICGIDFGSTHPTCAVWLAWDRDNDIIYVTDVYKHSNATSTDKRRVKEHAEQLLMRGAWIPVAWPGDGLNETAAGPALATQYREAGVNMLQGRAEYERTEQEGETTRSLVSVEAGIEETWERMLGGKWRVFKHLTDYWTELGQYHRKDGKIHKVGEDVLDAARYAMMCKRFAQTPPRKLEVVRSYGSNWRT